MEAVLVTFGVLLVFSIVFDLHWPVPERDPAESCFAEVSLD
jgi:hypothetical protein